MSARSSHLRSLVLPVLATACGDAPKAPLPAPRVVPFENPAPVASAQPGLTVNPAGRVQLSWQVRQPDSSLTLHFAGLDGDVWSAPLQVPTGPNMLGSATDVPSVAQLPSGALVAAWRGKHGPQGYDILVAHSADSGRTWSEPASPHHDATMMEHGFVSFLQLGDTSAMVWVDGRNNADADTSAQATQLTMATFDAAGAPQPETFLDVKICDCCHTSAAAAGGGTVIAYRDRKDGEIRDISVARWQAGTWRPPVTVHDDKWHYVGCPVNGPSIAAHNARVSVAWFTSAQDTARVRLAFSSDTANTFAPPIEINDGKPDGKVGLVLLPSGEALVSWIERREQEAVLRVRRVAPDGARSPAVDVATLGSGKRAGGMPRMAFSGGGALLTWTDVVKNRVSTVRVILP